MKSLTKRIKKQQRSDPAASLTMLDGFVEVRRSICSKVQHLYVYRNPKYKTLSADPASVAVCVGRRFSRDLTKEEKFVLNAYLQEVFNWFNKEPDFPKDDEEEIDTLAVLNSFCQIDFLGEPAGYGKERNDQAFDWTFCGRLTDNAPDNIGHHDIDNSIRFYMNMDGIYTDSESGMFWAYTNDERRSELVGFLYAFWPDLDFSTMPFNDDEEQSKEMFV